MGLKVVKRKYTWYFRKIDDIQENIHDISEKIWNLGKVMGDWEWSLHNGLCPRVQLSRSDLNLTFLSKLNGKVFGRSLFEII